jgi:peroxiredoxin
MSLVQPGRKASAFALRDQNGKTHRLRNYTGRPLILYFYPKRPSVVRIETLEPTGWREGA